MRELQCTFVFSWQKLCSHSFLVRQLSVPLLCLLDTSTMNASPPPPQPTAEEFLAKLELNQRTLLLSKIRLRHRAFRVWYEGQVVSVGRCIIRRNGWYQRCQKFGIRMDNRPAGIPRQFSVCFQQIIDNEDENWDGCVIRNSRGRIIREFH